MNWAAIVLVAAVVQQKVLGADENTFELLVHQLLDSRACSVQVDTLASVDDPL